MLPNPVLLLNASRGLHTRLKLENAYRSRHAALARFLAARLGDPDDAQDVLQELYIHIGKAEPTDEIRDPVAYVFRTAANLARDYVRTRRRAAARELAWATLQYPMGSSEALDDAPSAERAYEAKQRIAAVHRVLNELSPQCRRIFILHKLEGLTHTQIAEQAKISRSTVEKHMNTALKHLIGKLGRD
jgi:RNA polymerase sigma-70 factor (ECF subfamily)